MFMCIIALSICKPLDLIENIASAPMPTIPLCIGLAVATFVLPFFLFTWSMKYLPAGIASALSVVEPMAATVFSAVLFLPLIGIYICTHTFYPEITPRSIENLIFRCYIYKIITFYAKGV